MPVHVITSANADYQSADIIFKELIDLTEEADQAIEEAADTLIELQAQKEEGGEP